MSRLSSLILALALVASVSMPGRSEILKNLKTDGGIEVRAFGIDNEADLSGATDDHRSDIITRLSLGGSFDILDDVHARVQLAKNNRQYGEAQEDLNDVQSSIDVTNAYVKIDKVFGVMDLAMGRQYFGNEDDLIVYFGPKNDDALSITALDLFRADGSIKDWAKVTLIGGKTSSVTGNVNNDTDLWGAEVNSDKVIPKGNLAAYYYTSHDKGPAGTGNDTLIVAGLRAKGDILVGLGYSAEAAINGGRDHSVAGEPGYGGDVWLLGLNYKADLAKMPVRAAAELGHGTQDWQAIASDKRFGIIWGQQSFLGDTVHGTNVVNGPTGLTNLKVFDVTAGVDPISKLGVDVGFYRFMYSDGNQSPNGGGLTSAATEYDLILSWKHSDNVVFQASAASLQVGDAIRPAANSPVVRYGGDVKIKF